MRHIKQAEAEFRELCTNFRATKDLGVLELYAAAVKVVGAARKVERARRMS